jgi:hypothetical protein
MSFTGATILAERSAASLELPAYYYADISIAQPVLLLRRMNVGPP